MIHNYVCCQGSKSIGEREQDRNNSTRKENTRKLFRTDVILQCFLKPKVQVSREKKFEKRIYPCTYVLTENNAILRSKQNIEIEEKEKLEMKIKTRIIANRKHKGM